MNCPRCGRRMKLYQNLPESTLHPDRKMWLCKMHLGKWGVCVKIEGLKAAGRRIK